MDGAWLMAYYAFALLAEGDTEHHVTSGCNRLAAISSTTALCGLEDLALLALGADPEDENVAVCEACEAVVQRRREEGRRCIMVIGRPVGRIEPPV